jgi:hypothetical protein
MAYRAARAAAQQKRILIAIGCDAYHIKMIPAAFAFCPKLVTAAAEEGCQLGFERQLKRLGGHISKHQHSVCFDVLYDSGDKRVFIK